ncbi:MAG: TRAP transporter small permease subunit [Planctomycetota bacterium]|nr:TRAP transporter small permease subunit [Planctomycetota bacterium]
MRATRFFLVLLENLDLIISGLCLTVLVFLTALGVVMRYVLGSPLTWLEEVQLILLVWVAFFGSGAAFRAGGHVAIEALVEMFPVRLQRAVEAIDSLLVATILVLVAYWQFSRAMTLTVTGRSTSILGIPLSLNYFGVAAACLFMLVHFVRQRLALFGSWRRGGGRDA